MREIFIGVAFRNRDGSINLLLDFFPRDPATGLAGSVGGRRGGADRVGGEPAHRVLHVHV
ncbi:MAG: hypothetical protein WBM75_14380 [Polyangiales bacterium]